MAGDVIDRNFVKPTNWISVYLIAMALGLTTLGLVMLFSAGVVKEAHSLLQSSSFGWHCQLRLGCMFLS